jgi:hypothetical protein
MTQGHVVGLFCPLTFCKNLVRSSCTNTKNGHLKSKSQQIREALALGDQIGALRIVARFFDRSSATDGWWRTNLIADGAGHRVRPRNQSPWTLLRLNF